MASYDSKKTVALQAVKLGMEEEKAMLFAEFDEEELARVQEDKFFLNRLKFCALQEEYTLLGKFDEVMVKSADKGFSSDIRWKLGIINPKRYGTRPGDQADEGNSVKKGMRFSFNFNDGTATLESADNVEVFQPEPEVEELEAGGSDASLG